MPLSPSHAESRTGVAAPAIARVRVAEGAPAVVAGHAALGAWAGEMLRSENGADLPSLRQPPSHDGVATLASQTPARAVVRVAETDAVGARRGRSRRVRARPVARAARRECARLPAGRVASVASLVSAQTSGDALRDAAQDWCVTGRAAVRGPRLFTSLHVLRVVELGRETAQP